MIIIADSGSTKTDWIILDGVKVVGRYNSIGINPVYKSIKKIEEVLNSTFTLNLKFNEIFEFIIYLSHNLIQEFFSIFEIKSFK